MAFRYIYEYDIRYFNLEWDVTATVKYYNPDYIEEGTSEYETARYPLYRPEYGFASSYTEERIINDLNDRFENLPPPLNVPDYLLDSYDGPNYPKLNTDKNGKTILSKEEKDKLLSFDEVKQLISSDDIFSSGVRSISPWTENGLDSNQTSFEGDDLINMVQLVYSFVKQTTEDKRFKGTTLDLDTVPPYGSLDDSNPQVQTPPSGSSLESSPSASSSVTKLENKSTTTIPYKITGKIVDSENFQPIGGATIADINNYSFADSEPTGEFVIEGNALLKKPNSKSKKVKPFNLEITAEDYNSQTLKVVTLGGKTKESTGVTLLTPIQSNTESERMELENFTPEQIEQLKGELNKDFITKQLKKTLGEIKERIIPYLLILISEFGISQLNKLVDKLKKEGKAAVMKEIQAQIPTCPADIEILNTLIEKKNKLTKQINNLYKGIDKINKFLSPIEKLISSTEDGIVIAKTAANAIAFIPSTVGTPIPSGAYTKLSDAIKFLEDLIDKEGGKLKGGFFQLNFLKASIDKIIGMMDILDMLFSHCAEEISTSSDDPILTQTSISNQLLESTINQSNQDSPVVTNINGFDMDVISVDNVTIEGIKRRQAVAKNQAGIIMLKGEPSFSSNDQILIDELIFYIEQNDLKAD
jgi:hypothetical protein